MLALWEGILKIQISENEKIDSIWFQSFVMGNFIFYFPFYIIFLQYSAQNVIIEIEISVAWLKEQLLKVYFAGKYMEEIQPVIFKRIF